MHMKRFLLFLLAAFAFLALLGSPETTQATSHERYPDLRTLVPKDLRFDTETIDGSLHHVLRLSNTVWHAGEGRLELRGESPPGVTKTRVYQRIYAAAGSLAFEEQVGEFDYHPEHGHWHFGDFAEYELWTKAEYDKWIAEGRKVGAAQRRGTKTTFCIIDTKHVDNSLPGSPSSAQYTQCNNALQGLSIGWGDTYPYYLYEQWVDLGPSPLPDGQYVLRSIADPKDRIYESANKGDPTRESAEANEATTFFRVQRGRIRIQR